MYCHKQNLLSNNAGIYIHTPFCIKKCPYCDFYSISDISLKKAFISALLKELELRSKPEILVDTIYFGGGTPSLLTYEDIEAIMASVAKNFKVKISSNLQDIQNLQITIEVNPGTIQIEYLKKIRELGFNRLSIGVQSFNDKKLNFLERIHSSVTARKAIIDAKNSGFTDISIDLMYGLPEESENMWLDDLNAALEYSPQHISCYMLSYEPDTPMYDAYKKGDITPLSDDKHAALFKMTSEFLVSKGFFHYEVSNFAFSPKHQSIHNKKYWNMVQYLGFGPSAHSYYPDSFSNSLSSRFWNVKNVKKYISLLDEDKLPIAETEILTQEQILIELIMVGLRTERGIDIEVFERLFGASGQFRIMFKLVLERIEIRGWGKIDGNRYRLTVDGWLFLDTIIRWFVDALFIND